MHVLVHAAKLGTFLEVAEGRMRRRRLATPLLVLVTSLTKQGVPVGYPRFPAPNDRNPLRYIGFLLYQTLGGSDAHSAGWFLCVTRSCMFLLGSGAAQMSTSIFEMNLPP